LALNDRVVDTSVALRLVALLHALAQRLTVAFLLGRYGFLLTRR